MKNATWENNELLRPGSSFFSPFARELLSKEKHMTVLGIFTVFHVILSLLGIGAGFVVLFGWLTSKPFPRTSTLFLTTTIATSVTGFLFPFHQFGPSYVLGILSLLVLAVTVAARYRFHLAGPWRRSYAITAAVALYLNLFVLIAQMFKKDSAADGGCTYGSRTAFPYHPGCGNGRLYRYLYSSRVKVLSRGSSAGEPSSHWQIGRRLILVYRQSPDGKRIAGSRKDFAQQLFHSIQIALRKRRHRRARAAQTHTQQVRMLQRQRLTQPRHQLLPVRLMNPVLKGLSQCRKVAALQTIKQQTESLQIEHRILARKSYPARRRARRLSTAGIPASPQ